MSGELERTSQAWTTAWLERDAAAVDSWPCRPARKAHPGLRVDDLPGLLGVLRSAGVPVTEETDASDAAEHAYLDDPFGNRLELVGAEKDARRS